MKKILFFLIACATLTVASSFGFSKKDDIVSRFQHLSPQQLLDTADYYFNNHTNDSALLYYNLFINTTARDPSEGVQKKRVEALNKLAVIYYYMYDYRNSYEILIKALLLCEKYNYSAYESSILNNIGNIYHRFNKSDLSESYYSRALTLCQDSAMMAIVLNNLGNVGRENRELDSAFYYLNESMKISKLRNDLNLHITQHDIATLYKKTQQYDSAFYYSRLALREAEKNYQFETQAAALLTLGGIFFEMEQIDSAMYYIGLSNNIAVENNILEIAAKNYLALSEIEESKGNKTGALEYFKTYANLKDSIYEADKFAEINQLQHLYEITKTNQQIEDLEIEQEIKEREIRHQRMIWLITLTVLLLVSTVLIFIILQKRKLNKAYKALFEKNIQIIELQKKSSQKKKKETQVHNVQDELLDRILIIMEDTASICNTEFSLDKLAEMTQSNQKYVSQTVNSALKMNFRSFLNSYRIREAQRLFAEPEATKYTIESIALQVGFKSRTAFREAFKEITGVNPNFYLKSIQGQNDLINQREELL